MLPVAPRWSHAVGLDRAGTLAVIVACAILIMYQNRLVADDNEIGMKLRDSEVVGAGLLFRSEYSGRMSLTWTFINRKRVSPRQKTSLTATWTDASTRHRTSKVPGTPSDHGAWPPAERK